MASAAKSQGDLSELRFLLKSVELGLVVSKPYGENSYYDFIVDCKGKLKRIQVKSTSYMERETSTAKGRYSINCGHGRTQKKAYKKEHTDFIATYIIPQDCWYIIPVEKVNTTTINFSPHVKNSKGKYEKYRERWNLLT